MTCDQKSKIIVIDYHKGNLESVIHGISAAGGVGVRSDDPRVIQNASALILPGVGSFADAMAYLEKSGQKAAILHAIAQGTPFLGICLGLQLLFEQGTEGAHDNAPIDGLKVFSGTCVRLTRNLSQGIKVPHVGWNSIHLTREGARSPLFKGVRDEEHFYFTHSYIATTSDESAVLATTPYSEMFISAVGRNNVFGVQFHPEKSSSSGIHVLKRFVEIAESRR